MNSIVGTSYMFLWSKDNARFVSDHNVMSM